MSKIKVKKSVKLNQVKPTRMKRRFGIDVEIIRDLQQDYTVELDEKVARKMAKERYVIIVDDSEVFTPEDDLDDLDESNEVTADDDEENEDSNEDDSVDNSKDSDEDEQEQY